MSVTTRKEAFTREPDVQGRPVRRGVLNFGNERDQGVAFLWDYTKSKVYLDLNRNQDLTDDPTGVFTSNSRSQQYQEFEKVRLKLAPGVEWKTVMGSLDLYCWSGRETSGSFSLLCLWDGKISLQGQDWQIGYLEGDRRGQNSYLFLRPWTQRKDALSVDDGSQAGFAFRSNLFLNQKAYQMAIHSEPGTSNLQYKLMVQEKPVTTGPLRITGRFIDRLLLVQDWNPAGYVAVINNPGPVIQLPVGDYGAPGVWLKEGGRAAYLERARYGPKPSIEVKVKAQSEASLAVGGPLTNCVTASREGGTVVLNYKLLGAGGRTYEMANQDRSKPPGFVVTQNGKQLASGKFEYG
jgi:hypothetical protein